MKRSRSQFLFLSAFLFCLVLFGCMGGGGHGGGGGYGGGGGGHNNVDLEFTPTSTQSVTIVQGMTGMLTFVVQNTGNTATSAPTTVTFTMTSASGLTYSSNGSGGTGWDCSGSTSLTVSCTTQAPIAGGASSTTLTVILMASATSPGAGLQPTAMNTSNTSGGGPHSYTLNVMTTAMPNPAPVLTSISPTSVTAGGTSVVMLTANGSNFISSSVVQWNGTAISTAFVSSSQLTATVPTGDLTASGTANVTVMTPTPGGGTSSPQTFTVNAPPPAITSLNPSSAIVGSGAFTLTVTGNGFIANSVVKWNNAALTTVFFSATTLSAQVPASDIASGTSANVTVFNPGPPTGGLTSGMVAFTINTTNPAPTLSSISPMSVAAGYGAFTLTVNGSNFVSGSVVQWTVGSTTSTLPSTVYTDTLITASVPASDVTTAGSATVTVKNPPPPTGGQTSSPATFTINAAGSTSVKITQPLVPTVVLTVGQSLALFEAVIAPTTSSCGATGVQWDVGVAPGGNSGVGTITMNTASGAPATYTAPQSPPMNGGFATITAVCASNTNIVSASVTVLIVTGPNSALSGQFAYELSGFQASGLPFAAIGTMTANGSGGFTNLFQDTTASTGGGHVNTGALVPLSGWYAMDTPTHGYIQLFETANPTVFEDFSIEINSGGAFGSLIEVDGPGGNVASGGFQVQKPNSFNLGAGNFAGPWIMEISGQNNAGTTSAGVAGLFTVTANNGTVTQGTISGGDAYDTAGNHSTVSGPVTIDNPAVGHGTANMTFTGGTNLNPVTFYIVNHNHVFALSQDTASGLIETGGFHFQTMSSGYGGGGTGGILSVFSALGINSAGHSSAIAGLLTSSGHTVTGIYDSNDGGVVPGSAPGNLSGTATINSNGSGTVTFTSGPLPKVVFYQRVLGGGFFMEQPTTPGGATEGRVGVLIPQTPPTGGFADSNFDGLMLVGGTFTTTAKSPNGLGIATFHGTTIPATYTGVGDVSVVGLSPAFNGIFGGQYHFTDTTKGRGTLMTSTNSFFGSSNSAFYALDAFGDFVVVPQDNFADPQLIFVGP